jgi:hypothetical protein
MNFKVWFILSETLDDMTKGALEKYQAPKDELAAFIKELEDDPDLINRKDAFDRLSQRFPPTKQKPTKQEDGRIKLYQDKLNANQITKPEFDVFMLFIGESSKELVTEAMNLLRRFISNNIITLEVKNNKIYITKDNETKEFNDFTRFESELHSIRDNLTEYKQKSGVFNPVIGEQKYRNNLAAKGDKVWVFRGDTPELCRIFGKNQIWCISSSTSAVHWFDYRMRFHQTQYFVFDFNKEENDPARYVNPGVAPKGEHSEWVDARNTHTTDPEDRNSDFGVNGYTSINQYTRYLVSKDIPESIWTTTEPEEWEKSLEYYNRNKSFHGAKHDSDPRIFSMYLKIIEDMEDEDFETLTDEQKKEFIFGKLEMLTAKQFEFAKNISGYFNSLNLISKINFLSKTKKSDLLEDLIKKSELTYLSIATILHYAGNTLDKDKDRGLNDYMLTSHAYEIIKIISNTKKSFSDNLIRILLDPIPHRRAADKIIEVIISKMPDSFGEEINTLMYYAYDKVKIAEIIINKLSEISDLNFSRLLASTAYTRVESERKDTFNIANLLIAKKPELNSNNILNLMELVSRCGWGTNQIATTIINKKPDLSGEDVFRLIRHAFGRRAIAELLGDNISKMDFSNIEFLLGKDYKDELKTIFKKYYKGTDPNIISLLNQ